MTPPSQGLSQEQKRIIQLEDTLLALLDQLEASRVGFGTHMAEPIRDRIKSARRIHSFSPKSKSEASSTSTKPQSTPPATPPATPNEEEAA